MNGVILQPKLKLYPTMSQWHQ